MQKCKDTSISMDFIKNNNKVDPTVSVVRNKRQQAKIVAVDVVDNTNLCTDAKLWHLRKGHLPFKQLYLLFPELKAKVVYNDLFCTICPLAKKARDPFIKSEINSIEPFQLLHIDI